MGSRIQTEIWGWPHSRVWHAVGLRWAVLGWCSIETNQDVKNSAEAEKLKKKKKVGGSRPVGASMLHPPVASLASYHPCSVLCLSRLWEGARWGKRGSYIWWQMGLCLVWASVTKSGLSPTDGRTNTGVETHLHWATPEPSLAKCHIILHVICALETLCCPLAESVAC